MSVLAMIAEAFGRRSTFATAGCHSPGHRNASNLSQWSMWFCDETCNPRGAGRWLVAVRVLVARGNRGRSDLAAHDAARCPGRPWTRATASFREGVSHR